MMLKVGIKLNSDLYNTGHSIANKQATSLLVKKNRFYLLSGGYAVTSISNTPLY
jgi:hypothetical protein